VQPVAIFAGCDQKLGLLGRESPYPFFKKQVNGHTNGGQRALQLMRDGGDDASFQLLLLSLLGHIPEGQGRRLSVVVDIKDRNGLWTKVMFFSLHKMLKDFLLSLGHDRSTGPQGF